MVRHKYSIGVDFGTESARAVLVDVAGSTQTPVLGSTMFGAVAAGSLAGGYDTIFEASRAMAHLRARATHRILCTKPSTTACTTNTWHCTTTLVEGRTTS